MEMPFVATKKALLGVTLEGTGERLGSNQQLIMADDEQDV